MKYLYQMELVRKEPVLCQNDSKHCFLNLIRQNTTKKNSINNIILLLRAYINSSVKKLILYYILLYLQIFFTC